MAVPGNISYITLRGWYVNASGQPMSGRVSFTPNTSRMRDEGADVFIGGVPVVASLDGDGKFSVSLMIGDDPDVEPTDWTYLVEEDLRAPGTRGVVRASYSIALTSDLAPGPVQLADLDPTTPVVGPGGSYVRSVNGETGDVTITLVGLGAGNSATRNVGTTAGTVAAGDDARLASFTVPSAGQVATSGGLRADRLTAGAASQNARKLYVEDGTATSEAALIKTTAVGTASTPAAAVEVSGATKKLLELRVTGDTAGRLIFDLDSGNGRITFSDGTTADVALSRSAADTLKAAGDLVVTGQLAVGGSEEFAEANTITADTIGTAAAIYARATDLGTGSVAVLVIETEDLGKRGLDYKLNGDATSRFRIDTSKDSGTAIWGDGDNADANLYRSAAETLKTDGDLVVVGNITAGSISVSGSTPTDAAGYIFEAPAGAVLRALLPIPTAATVTAVKGFRVGGSGASFNARNGATNKLLSTDMSLGTASSWTTGTGLQNTAISAGGYLQVEVTGVTGTPTYIAVIVEYQVAP